MTSSARLFAIGDIHGNLTALNALLTAIEPTPQDTLVFLGDFVDRGSDSKGVIDRIQDLMFSGVAQVVALQGNHEQALLMAHLANKDQGQESIDHHWRTTMGGQACVDSYVDGQVSADHIQFILQLSSFYETDRFIFTHAPISPTLPVEQQTSAELFWRVCGQDELAQGRSHISGKTLVNGHQALGRCPTKVGNAWFVDTGMPYANGWLSALELNSLQAIQANGRGQIRRVDCTPD